MVFSLNQIPNVSLNYKLQFISKISPAYLILFNDNEEHEFPHTCTISYLKRWARFFSTVTWVLQLHTVWNQKKIGLLILLNSEAAILTVFTAMCPKEQQTSDNLIVKDNCFITEMFDKCSMIFDLTKILLPKRLILVYSLIAKVTHYQILFTELKSSY